MKQLIHYFLKAGRLPGMSKQHLVNHAHDGNINRNCRKDAGLAESLLAQSLAGKIDCSKAICQHREEAKKVEDSFSNGSSSVYNYKVELCNNGKP